MRTVILQAGRECPEPFDSIQEARTALSAATDEELAAARRISAGARKHKNGEDSYLITLGSDRRSSLWTCLCLAPA